MTGSAGDRLRRLRWSLTALFTGMNTIGLLFFAGSMVAVDNQRGEERLDADLRRVTSSVLRLIRYESGAIDFAAVGDDQLDAACPEFVILASSDRPFQGRPSKRDCVDVDLTTLNALTQESVRSGTRLAGYVRGPDNGLVRVGVEPFIDAEGGQYAGAVVAASDADVERDRHERVLLTIVAGCIGLISSVALAGYVLAGRMIRPATNALDQQEMLLADTAHDLRTPVAALRALAEAAANDPTQRTELLPRTVRLAARMGDIIDGLLIRARLAAGVEQLAIQPVWLDQLVAGVVEDTPSNGAQVTLIAAPTKVDADPILVQRAVANLLDNALRYGRPADGTAVVTLTVTNGRLIVADRGPGVDLESGDVLERFTSSGRSAGLGLSIVRWVAESHGGTLTIANADEGGAIFELTLPVHRT